MYKVCCVIAGVVLFVPFWVLAQSSSPPSTARLAAMRDHFRPLLIFYPQISDSSSSGTLLQRQRALFTGHETDFKERDVVVSFVPAPNEHKSGTAGAEMELWNRFHIDHGSFTVVLLGKDGDEKFRSHEPVTIEKLDALIDAMPMRQQEMRDGNHAE